MRRISILPILRKIVSSGAAINHTASSLSPIPDSEFTDRHSSINHINQFPLLLFLIWNLTWLMLFSLFIAAGIKGNRVFLIVFIAIIALGIFYFLQSLPRRPTK